MDAAYVSLVALLLRADGFEEYRCDRNLTFGINLESMFKVLKTAQNDDIVTICAEDNGDTVQFIFESKNRVSDFELKLLDIDIEILGIPPTEYKSIIKMPAPEFQRICINLSAWGDNVVVSTSKNGVKFSVTGESGSGNMLVKQSAAEDDAGGTTIVLDEEVTLTFALQKLRAFTKATPLSSTVTLSMSVDVPLVTEYVVAELGYIRYYLAPKIEDDTN
jgi:proliferating cell nuclear antigen